MYDERTYTLDSGCGLLCPYRWHIDGRGVRSALKEVNWFEGCGGGTGCEALAEGEGSVGGATGTEIADGTGSYPAISLQITNTSEPARKAKLD